MFEGYREVRPLPPGTEDLVKPFLRMRLAGVAGWLLARTDNPEFREKAPDWAHSLCESIRMLDV
jgi:Ser/Thr protein kinase RdoA (MazF antagonist)